MRLEYNRNVRSECNFVHIQLVHFHMCTVAHLHTCTQCTSANLHTVQPAHLNTCPRAHVQQFLFLVSRGVSALVVVVVVIVVTAEVVVVIAIWCLRFLACPSVSVCVHVCCCVSVHACFSVSVSPVCFSCPTSVLPIRAVAARAVSVDHRGGTVHCDLHGINFRRVCDVELLDCRIFVLQIDMPIRSKHMIAKFSVWIEFRFMCLFQEHRFSESYL